MTGSQLSHHRIREAVAYLRGRLSLWPEGEIIVRSRGEQKSIPISVKAQIAAICITAIAVLAVFGVALNMVLAAADLKHERDVLAAESKLVDGKASKVAQYHKSVDQLARDLEERQDFIDELYRTHFGEKASESDRDLLGSPDAAKSRALNTKISSTSDADPLLQIDARQRQFAILLAEGVRQRADKAAAAIRSFGLNPNTVVRGTARAQGGPFVPWQGNHSAMPTEFEKLANALSRMELLENSLSAMPSGRPTAAPMLSSSFGYRRDPFNGHAAFHAGVDFPGSYGQPILSAAPGKVSFVGQRSGYGNVVEIEHGNGLMTRYAHLSGFNVRPGQQVARGASIARMGSTGRSTGTHLHFEVRLRGEAINPRRFLEAGEEALKAQQLAKIRLSGVEAQG